MEQKNGFLVNGPSEADPATLKYTGHPLYLDTPLALLKGTVNELLYEFVNGGFVQEFTDDNKGTHLAKHLNAFACAALLRWAVVNGDNPIPLPKGANQDYETLPEYVVELCCAADPDADESGFWVFDYLLDVELINAWLDSGPMLFYLPGRKPLDDADD